MKETPPRCYRTISISLRRPQPLLSGKRVETRLSDSMSTKSACGQRWERIKTSRDRLAACSPSPDVVQDPLRPLRSFKRACRRGNVSLGHGNCHDGEYGTTLQPWHSRHASRRTADGASSVKSRYARRWTTWSHNRTTYAPRNGGAWHAPGQSSRSYDRTGAGWWASWGARRAS